MPAIFYILLFGYTLNGPFYNRFIKYIDGQVKNTPANGNISPASPFEIPLHKQQGHSYDARKYGEQRIGHKHGMYAKTPVRKRFQQTGTIGIKDVERQMRQQLHGKKPKPGR